MRGAQKRRHLKNALPIGTATKTWNERRLCLLTVAWLWRYAFLTLIEPAGLIVFFNLKRLNYILSLSQHAGDLGQLCLLPRAQIFAWDQTKFSPSWERLGNLHAGTFTLRQAENSEGLAALKWEVRSAPFSNHIMQVVLSVRACPRRGSCLVTLFLLRNHIENTQRPGSCSFLVYLS